MEGYAVNRFFFVILTLLFGISHSAGASDTAIYIDTVHGEGEYALKAIEYDKLLCVAGTNLGELKKKTTLCAHEVKAMMQHFAMSQNLGLGRTGSIKGPEHHFQNAEVVFRAYIEMGRKKDGTPRAMLRIQRLEGGNPPRLVKEQSIPVSSIPKNHEISFIQDLMLSLL